MKKLVLLITIILLAMATPVLAGDNFHRGFHQQLGANTADALFVIVGQVLKGDFNDGYVGCNPRKGRRIRHIPPPRLMPPTGNAARWARSPRDRAYYQAKDRIYRQEYRRWEREQAQIGRAEGELKALKNIQRNRNKFFYRH